MPVVVPRAVWCELMLPTLVLFTKDLIQLLEIKTILFKLALDGLRSIGRYFLDLLLLREHLLVELRSSCGGRVLIGHFSRFGGAVWGHLAVVRS